MLGTLNFLDDEKRVGRSQLDPPGEQCSHSLSPSTRTARKRVAAPDEPGAHHARHRRWTPNADRDSRTDWAEPTTSSRCPCRARPSGTGSATSSTTARAWNGRRAGDVVTSEGDQFTGIETRGAVDLYRARCAAGRRPAAFGDNGGLPDGFAITVDHLEATMQSQGVESGVGRGDIVLVRTGRLTRARRDGWGDYAGGPAAGLSFTTAGWLHDTEIAAIATDTWGFEVRPNEFDEAFQPLHQVAIPHLGLFIGEMWDLDALADDCADDGIYEFLLTAAPLKVTGAVGAPVNPIATK